MDFFGRNWNFSEKSTLKLVKNGSKNGGLKANTTSSSSKFWQDFKNARVFHVDPVAVHENRVFVRQGGVENQKIKQNNKIFFFFVGNFQSLISMKSKSKPLCLIQNFVQISKMSDFFP